jgi:hypothetical protein
VIADLMASVAVTVVQVLVPGLLVWAAGSAVLRRIGT